MLINSGNQIIGPPDIKIVILVAFQYVSVIKFRHLFFELPARNRLMR